MLRIVSLIASATEIVHSLDLGSAQVGRSHECDYPESVRNLPVCTRPRVAVNGDSREIDQAVKQALAEDAAIYEVFPDILEQLRPTHVITQTQCKVCAVSLHDVERALSSAYPWQPKVVALEPNSLTDIWSDIRRVADACDVSARGESLVGSLQGRMNQAAAKVRGRSRVRVACIEWLEPLMSAGNWMPELVEMAGGVNLFGQSGAHSPWMSWEELQASDPDVIVALPCGFDLDRTLQEMHWLTSLPGWDKLRARIYAADGNAFFNRPGPRVVESLDILIDMFHSDKKQGPGWVRLPGNLNQP